MEAGNRGAAEVGAPSIGLNIVLPHEQAPNRFVTPELSFNFHYFAIRKMHFLLRAKAVAVFPGGFGTLDELFETMTLMQTGRLALVPLILFGEKFWRTIINFEALAEFGTIAPNDVDLIRFVETADEAWDIISKFYQTVDPRSVPMANGADSASPVTCEAVSLRGGHLHFRFSCILCPCRTTIDHQSEKQSPSPWVPR